jgi:choline kinase
LIDREHELRILRRLAKKNIGPRVLGTFKNGRFEQYFDARPLTARELRMPETSIQIAKRMRELHDGIDLLPEERAAGPTVWKNWDNWVTRCEQVITWLDNEVVAEHANSPDEVPKEAWRKRGYVCGVPWSMFRRTVERYRKWLEDVCGGSAAIRQKLVFAHNDVSFLYILFCEAWN